MLKKLQVNSQNVQKTQWSKFFKFSKFLKRSEFKSYEITILIQSDAIISILVPQKILNLS